MRNMAIVSFGILCLLSPLAASPGRPSPSPPPAPALVPGVGQFGQPYLLRDSVSLTLKSAEYTVARVVIGDKCFFPQAGEKLLLLRFRVQNTRKDALDFDGETIPFSVTDAAGAVHKSVQEVGRETTHESAEMELKPGEAADDLYTVLVTSGTGADRALVVEAGREGRDEDSLRVSLPGQVKPLAVPFADPGDPSGATALSRISARKGVLYPLALLDARLDSCGFTTQTLGGSPPDSGQRYFTAIFTVKNKSGGSNGISGVDFAPLLCAASGTSLDYNQTILQPERDVPADTVLPASAETRVRFFWPVPKDICPQSLSLTEGESRAYVYEVAGAK